MRHIVMGSSDCYTVPPSVIAHVADFLGLAVVVGCPQLTLVDLAVFYDAQEYWVEEEFEATYNNCELIKLHEEAWLEQHLRVAAASDDEDWLERITGYDRGSGYYSDSS